MEELRIEKRCHPDGNCDCWEVQELRPSQGKYAIPGNTYWRSLTIDPFASKLEAERFLQGYEFALTQQPESEPVGYTYSESLQDLKSCPPGTAFMLPVTDDAEGDMSEPVFIGPQPTPQVPERKGEIQKDWWIEKAKHLLEKGSEYADVQRNNIAADEESCSDPDEEKLWRDLEIHSVNCRNLIGFNLTAAPSISEEREAEPDLPLADGYVLLPRELTAENGAKYLLSGEFSESVTLHCAHCDGEDFDCEICNGADEYSVDVIVEWTTIKNIYRMVVEHLSRPAPPAGGE